MQAEATNHEVLPASPTTQPKPAGGAGIPETTLPTWSLEELQASGKVDAQGHLKGRTFTGSTDLPPSIPLPAGVTSTG